MKGGREAKLGATLELTMAAVSEAEAINVACAFDANTAVSLCDVHAQMLYPQLQGRTSLTHMEQLVDVMSEIASILYLGENSDEELDGDDEDEEANPVTTTRCCRPGSAELQMSLPV